MKLPLCHSDETPVKLTTGQKEQTRAALNEIRLAAVQLDSLVGKNELTVSGRYTTFRYIDTRVEKISKILGYDADTDAVKESYLERIKELNNEVAELKKQLGGSIDLTTATSFFLSYLKELKNFMKSLGLSSYMKDEHFKSYYPGMCFEGLVSCSFSEDDYFLEEVTKNIGMEAYLKQRIENFEKQGLKFYKNDIAGKYLNLIDVPENRNWLIDKFKEKYPTSLFFEFENHIADDKKTYILQMAKVRIIL